MEIEEPTVEQLKALIYEALICLYRRDRDMIRRRVHEAAIAHQLANHLEVLLRQHLDLEQFDPANYDVDIEYDRNGEDAKRLVPGEDGKRPDIIVHKRGHNANNLLIIEVKKNRRYQISQSDDSKLRGATDPDYDFRYTLGLYLNLKTDCAELTWYRNGAQDEVIRQNLEGLGYGE